MSRTRIRVAAPVAVAAALFVAFATFVALVPPASGADAPSAATAAAARTWLVAHQQTDGGFEVAGFPGFETPDAVLAIAEAAQTSGSWNAGQALAAVSALHYGGAAGPTPLDALDDFVDAGISAGQAAKLVVLVVAPLGLDPADFDPSADSPNPVDLAALIDPAGCAGNPADFGFFNQTLYGALAKRILCGVPNAAVLATIRAAQRADGGWNFLGAPADLPFPADSDADTTSLAIQALVAGGAAWNDSALTKGLGFLAAQQQANGSFPSFGSDDPNSTAVALIAVGAAGFDPAVSCWRDTANPAVAGTPYGDPTAWLRAQQQPDGHIASPNDGFGVNTFATSQAIEGLLGAWLPLVRASGAPTCAPPLLPPPVEAAPEVVVAPRFTG